MSLKLPKTPQVNEFLASLTGKNPRLSTSGVPMDMVNPTYGALLCTLSDTNDQPIGAIALDLSTALYLGGTFIMLPEIGLKEQFERGEASEAVIDALDEVFNMLRSLLNRIEDNPAVTPSELAAYVPGEDNAWLTTPTSRLDLAGNFPVGGPGFFTLIAR